MPRLGRFTAAVVSAHERHNPVRNRDATETKSNPWYICNAHGYIYNQVNTIFLRGNCHYFHTVQIRQTRNTSYITLSKGGAFTLVLPGKTREPLASFWREYRRPRELKRSTHGATETTTFYSLAPPICYVRSSFFSVPPVNTVDSDHSHTLKQ